MHAAASLPYLTCGVGWLTPSAETSGVGPVRNPEVPEGYHNLLEVQVYLLSVQFFNAIIFFTLQNMLIC